MKTCEVGALMEGLEIRKIGSFDGLSYKISGVSADSRKAQAGGMFLSFPGPYQQIYLQEALKKGVRVVLIEQGNIPALEAGVEEILWLEVPSLRYTLSQVASRIYPDRPETLAAVTGTNGKTSVASFTRQIWSSLGYEGAFWGTTGLEASHEVLKRVRLEASLTTPDPLTLHQGLESLAHNGVTHMSLEASSHGLDQHRLSGICVKAAAFTQLSQDHLDYHGTMEAYFQAKCKLFQEILAPEGVAVLNADVPEFEALAQICRERKIEFLTYGWAAQHLRLEAVRVLPEGWEVEGSFFGQKETVFLPLRGAFQIMNVWAALGLVYGTGGDLKAALSMLKALKGVSGRMEYIGKNSQGAQIFVDFAHTPDALNQILGDLRPHTLGKLWVVFGCGGDRDKTKRPLMGKIAGEKADCVVVTDDNPRFENPEEIRREILSGCFENTKEIADRAEAIKWVCEKAQEGDLVVIAGKGHEEGQIVGEKVFSFSDQRVVKSFI